MALSISVSKQTIGQLLFQLRMKHPGCSGELYKALRTTSSTYLKIERDQRELSFLMALRVSSFYKLDLHEFISMLSDQELDRQDFSLIRVQQQREKKKAEAAKARVIDIKTQAGIPEVKL